jgi:tetratricopeptide (TPR) repeat protein
MTRLLRPRPCAACVAFLAVALAAVVVRAEEPAGDSLEAARAATARGGRHLEAGELDLAVAALEEAHRLRRDDVAARRNLALALSRKAETLLRRKDGESALALLDRALELHPGRLRYEMLRGQAFRRAGRLGEALRSAQHVVAARPDYADGWVLLADVHERGGNLREAREALEHVKALDPGSAAVARRIADVTRRAEAQERFLTHGSGNFEVRYSPDADPATVRLALTLLEDAYARVTADLGLAPRTPARVVLYEGAEFQRITGAHSWVGALYANGTLKLPTRNLERHRATAARVLAHEFTHHLLRERTPSLPIWWHEGIAQLVEDDEAAGRERRRRLDERLAPLVEHEALLTVEQMRRLSISRVADRNLVKLFYSQALSFVGWLVDSYGPGALPSFLVALGTDADLDAAARKAFGDDVGTLFARWRDAL